MFAANQPICSPKKASKTTKPKANSKATGKANKDPKTTKPRPQPFPADSVIRVLVKDNPKKPGTVAHLKFGLLKDGMTVHEFREAARKHDELKGRLSLSYDVKHEYVKLEPAD